MNEEEERTDGPERRRRLRKRLGITLAAVVFLLAVLLVPPMISISRYKSQITHIVAQSLGRPVRLAAVELRLLPRPGFVLTDLTVDEDPVYGSEPMLHANTVTASMGFFALWRGKLEISRIGVDEASVNLVRTGDGHWNLDPIFRTATGAQGAAHPAHHLPYLEATNSRINIKNGIEKLPFSLMNADLSFWESDPGVWRLRLRAQPTRTDVHLAMADTGIVRLEATMQRAPQLRQMPVHMDVEWKEAQLGQLSRLLIGSDPGWRGDLTGQMQLDGTAQSAQVKARLKATGVHRAEFTPADPMDFDANCSFTYHYSQRSVEKLACDSPLGEGHVQLKGDLPAQGTAKLAVDVERVPVSAGLDALRTLRSGIADDLTARGVISGQLNYDPAAADAAAADAAKEQHGRGARKAAQPGPGALAGSLTVDGFQLSGGGLSQPVQIAKVVFAPAPVEPGQPEALVAELALPAGAPAPLAMTVRLESRGYQVGVRGMATLQRLRELAAVAGTGKTGVLGSLTGDTAALDLTAQGPWLAAENAELNTIERAGSSQETAQPGAATDQLSGTVTLHAASWQSADLANPVTLTDATLHVSGKTLVWDGANFAYGPVKGTASLQLASDCPEGEECPPRLDVHFDRLDAATLQAALLGAQKPGTMVSTLLARFGRHTAPLWPRLEGTLHANALVLGPMTLEKVSIGFRVLPARVEFTAIDAGLLSGTLHATGAMVSGDKPAYSFDGGFDKMSGPMLCQLLKMHCTGGTVSGGGKFSLAGYSGDDLAASAGGAMHFEWRQGAITAPGAPKTLARFSRWTGEGTISRQAVTLKRSQVFQGGRTAAVDASVTLSETPKIAFPPVQPAETAHR